eukprot:8087430-Ditylum_brightwellii.AAC.1
MTAFVKGIEHLDFEMGRQLMESYLLEIDCIDRTMNVKAFTDMVESHQRGLNKVADKDMEVKSRHTQFNKSIRQPTSENDLHTALQIPNALF